MGNPETIEAELVADTRSSEQRLGFRSAGNAERRILFRARDAYLELRVPPTGRSREASGWLYGQLIQPDSEAPTCEPPIYAVLQGAEGVTGAVKATDVGDFAVPFRGTGDFVLRLEPAGGPAIRARFRQ
jgi:hypothetical protein